MMGRKFWGLKEEVLNEWPLKIPYQMALHVHYQYSKEE
jgi:hypothetical protein